MILSFKVYMMQVPVLELVDTLKSAKYFTSHMLLIFNAEGLKSI